MEYISVGPHRWVSERNSLFTEKFVKKKSKRNLFLNEFFGDFSKGMHGMVYEGVC